MPLAKDVIMPVVFLTVGFYALMPYNGAFAVTIWKDIPFAGCMTIFAAALMRFLLRGSFAASSDAVPKLRVSEYFTLLIPYVLSGTLLCLLRTNTRSSNNNRLSKVRFLLAAECRHRRLYLPFLLILFDRLLKL